MKISLFTFSPFPSPPLPFHLLNHTDPENTLNNYSKLRYLECTFAPLREPPFIPIHFMDVWHVANINQCLGLKGLEKAFVYWKIYTRLCSSFYDTTRTPSSSPKKRRPSISLSPTRPATRAPWYHFRYKNVCCFHVSGLYFLLPNLFQVPNWNIGQIILKKIHPLMMRETKQRETEHLYTKNKNKGK